MDVIKNPGFDRYEEDAEFKNFNFDCDTSGVKIYFHEAKFDNTNTIGYIEEIFTAKFPNIGVFEIKKVLDKASTDPQRFAIWKISWSI